MWWDFCVSYTIVELFPLAMIGWAIGSISEITGSKPGSKSIKILAVRLLLIGRMADNWNRLIRLVKGLTLLR
jgi:hypothetical protein